MLTRRNIIIFCSIALCCVVIASGAFRMAIRRISSDFYFPFISLLPLAERKASESALMLKPKGELASELARLRNENIVLSARSVFLEKARLENRELRELLGLQKQNGYKSLFAEILIRDPAQWYEKFTINKGIRDGVREGCIVMALIPEKTDAKDDSGRGRKNTFAVVGRVESATAHGALVKTVLSRECSIGAFLPSNGGSGILAGGLRREDSFRFQVKYLQKDIRYIPDDPAVTSPLSQGVPPYLYIGRLAGTEDAEIEVSGGIYVKAWFESDIDFDRLRFLVVLVPEDSQ